MSQFDIVITGGRVIEQLRPPTLDPLGASSLERSGQWP